MLSGTSLGAGLLLTVAALAMTLPAGNGAAQIAATPGPGQIITPDSSLVRPEDYGLRAHTNVKLFVPAGTPQGRLGPTAGAGPQGGPPFLGFLFNTPASVACAYRLVVASSGCNPNIVTTNPSGGSNAIAVVDAFDTPSAASDLQTFNSQFGLPAANFQVIYAATGSCTPGGIAPANSAGSGWDVETILDTEWAHAMAPSAKLYLVEANSDSLLDLLAADAVASLCVQATGGGQVSNSWAFAEFSGETFVDPVFTAANVEYFAAAGDAPGVSYPAASPNVIAVGGTTFSFGGSLPGETDVFQGELPWNDDRIGVGTGGGPSAVEARPAYQNHIAAIVASSRGTPDLAALADPSTGVWIFSTSTCGGWCIAGGTSLATPVVAGIFNASGVFASSSVAALATIYSEPYRALHVTEIDTGACGIADQYNPSYMERIAHLSWNWCAGWGTLHGNR